MGRGLQLGSIGTLPVVDVSGVLFWVFSAPRCVLSDGYVATVLIVPAQTFCHFSLFSLFSRQRPSVVACVTQVSRTRTWKDEVSPEILDKMDDILRTWLPPVLLARFGLT